MEMLALYIICYNTAQMAPVLALNFSDSFMDVGKYVRHKIVTPLTQSIIIMCSCTLLEVHPASTLSGISVSMET